MITRNVYSLKSVYVPQTRGYKYAHLIIEITCLMCHIPTLEFRSFVSMVIGPLNFTVEL